MRYRLARVALLWVFAFSLGVSLGGIRSALAQGEGGERGLHDTLGENHPALVHSPIALTLAAGLAEVLFLVTRRAAFAHAARFCIFIAALGAIAAVFSGWIAFGEQTAEADESAGDLVVVVSGEAVYLAMLRTHRAFALAAASAIIVSAVLSELGRIRRNRWPLLAYRVLLLAAMVLVVFAGYYGGKFVFG